MENIPVDGTSNFLFNFVPFFAQDKAVIEVKMNDLEFLVLVPTHAKLALVKPIEERKKRNTTIFEGIYDETTKNPMACRKSSNFTRHVTN